MAASASPVGGSLSDEEVIRRVMNGETPLYEVIMRRYNQRLFRVALSIVGDPGEAEDVIQDAYVKAYTHLDQFAGEAKFSTWLTRIAVYEALARSRKSRRQVQMPLNRDESEHEFPTNEPNPEILASEGEARALLESAIQALPPRYQAVFMLREVEGLSTAETAQCLDIKEENVKIRLLRSRKLLRAELYARAGVASSSAFQFLGERCDRTVRIVLRRIQGRD
ncbi:MAG TPA: RNA polymerase sigma factor [Bryobacteraceae bacterium]|nr:RNA polymerase sigma factor [Bryobacteraceae bacterium]